MTQPTLRFFKTGERVYYAHEEAEQRKIGTVEAVEKTGLLITWDHQSHPTFYHFESSEPIRRFLL